MKRITFFVTSLKEGKIVKLIREVDKVACNIEIDFEKNIIVLSDLNEDMLETCVDLVNSCYKSISKIKIDNDESSTNKSNVKRKKANISKPEKVLEKANVPKAVKKENTENVETAIRKTFKTAFDNSRAIKHLDYPSVHPAALNAAVIIIPLCILVLFIFQAKLY